MDALADSPLDVRQAVELMVSELATNSVRHAQTSFELMVHNALDEIRVEVTDRGGGTPTMRSPGPSDPTGRGLRIVDMLADRWGVDEDEAGGKTVWFTLAAATTADATQDSAYAGSDRSRRPVGDAPKNPPGRRVFLVGRGFRARTPHGESSP